SCPDSGRASAEDIATTTTAEAKVTRMRSTQLDQLLARGPNWTRAGRETPRHHTRPGPRAWRQTALTFARAARSCDAPNPRPRGRIFRSGPRPATHPAKEHTNLSDPSYGAGTTAVWAGEERHDFWQRATQVPVVHSV